jgi:hypothetical protein
MGTGEATTILHALNSLVYAVIHSPPHDRGEVERIIERARKNAEGFEWRKLVVKCGEREWTFYHGQ